MAQLDRERLAGSNDNVLFTCRVGIDPFGQLGSQEGLDVIENRGNGDEELPVW